ncbi:MAG: hypothetical protein GXO50_00880 [Chlorobi bacterium]|nr:hypothetical protein [Chlorobiota bacterium]
MKKRLLKFVFAALIPASAFFIVSCKGESPTEQDPSATVFEDDGYGNITVTDRGNGVGDITFTSDKIWLLNGFVFVNEGQVLTIEPGTLIKGKPGTGENAGALIVARGGKIIAEGTSEKPIIFTAEADNREGTGVDMNAAGLWGGLIILGKATTNNLTLDKAIEGIPTSETRGLYGGNDDNDNSGIIKYVSVRHGGSDIGEGNEINGLTLGAVGRGTVIDNVEIVANKDDGIEFFGGAVTVKHALVVNCGDDSFDYDQGYHGKGQFWVSIQAEYSDRGGEHDGGPSDNETGTPYAIPEIYNVTYISAEDGNSRTFTLRDNAGVTYANSLFVNFDKGIDIEYLQDESGNTAECSFKMFQNGKVNIKNNVFYNVAGQTDNDDFDAAELLKISVPEDENGNPVYEVPEEYKNAWTESFLLNDNIVADPGISSGNPVPENPQTDNLAPYPEGLDEVNYKGAFGDVNWAKGWTLTFK